jgi:hypothetical protein
MSDRQIKVTVDGASYVVPESKADEMFADMERAGKKFQWAPADAAPQQPKLPDPAAVRDPLPYDISSLVSNQLAKDNVGAAQQMSSPEGAETELRDIGYLRDPRPSVPPKPAGPEPETFGTKVGDFAYPAVNSAALGWGDELAGLLNKDWGDAAKQRLALAHQRSPILAGAGDVTGAVGTGLLTGGVGGAGALANVARAVALGAANGAGNQDSDRFGGALKGGALGAIGGGLGAAGGKLFGSGTQAVGNAAEAVENQALSKTAAPALSLTPNEAEIEAAGQAAQKIANAGKDFGAYQDSIVGGAQKAAKVAGTVGTPVAAALGMSHVMPGGGVLGALSGLLGGGSLASKMMAPFEQGIANNAPAIGNAAGRAMQGVGGLSTAAGTAIAASPGAIEQRSQAQSVSGYGNRLPDAVSAALQQDPQILGHYAQELGSVANDPARLSATIARLSETDQQFRTEILPQLQKATASFNPH